MVMMQVQMIVIGVPCALRRSRTWQRGCWGPQPPGRCCLRPCCPGYTSGNTVRWRRRTSPGAQFETGSWSARSPRRVVCVSRLFLTQQSRRSSICVLVTRWWRDGEFRYGETLLAVPSIRVVIGDVLVVKGAGVCLCVCLRSCKLLHLTTITLVCGLSFYWKTTLTKQHDSSSVFNEITVFQPLPPLSLSLALSLWAFHVF